jgi:hypothetical protein
MAQCAWRDPDLTDILDQAARDYCNQFFVGAVGYVYQQLTPDTGQPAFLGSFESRVFGVGPQVGYLFPAGNMQGYLNLKGYYEFEAQNRPEGWNVWLTLALTPPEKSRAPFNGGERAGTEIDRCLQARQHCKPCRTALHMGIHSPDTTFNAVCRPLALSVHAGCGSASRPLYFRQLRRRLRISHPLFTVKLPNHLHRSAHVGGELEDADALRQSHGRVGMSE